MDEIIEAMNRGSAEHYSWKTPDGLVIEVGREMEFPDFGVAVTLEGHSCARKLRIKLREIPETHGKVRVKRLTSNRKKD